MINKHFISWKKLLSQTYKLFLIVIRHVQGTRKWKVRFFTTRSVIIGGSAHPKLCTALSTCILACTDYKSLDILDYIISAQYTVYGMSDECYDQYDNSVKLSYLSMITGKNHNHLQNNNDVQNIPENCDLFIALLFSNLSLA